MDIVIILIDHSLQLLEDGTEADALRASKARFREILEAQFFVAPSASTVLHSTLLPYGSRKRQLALWINHALGTTRTMVCWRRCVGGHTGRQASKVAMNIVLKLP